MKIENEKVTVNKGQLLSYQQKNNIALFLALLFHMSGAIGILFTSYKQWFISNTPVNLLIMSALLMFTQKEKNPAFFFFVLLCYATGMITEIIGVNTGYLFGKYEYGEVLGPKLYHVPWLIG